MGFPKRFKRNYPRVPLQGLIQTNHLVLRQNTEVILETTDDTKPWNEAKLPPSKGIPPRVALDRL